MAFELNRLTVDIYMHTPALLHNKDTLKYVGQADSEHSSAT